MGVPISFLAGIGAALAQLRKSNLRLVSLPVLLKLRVPSYLADPLIASRIGEASFLSVFTR